MIEFNCNGCGRPLQIGEEWAGKLGRCCHCGVNSPVPNSQQTNYPKRSSRVGIIAKMVAYPAAVVGSTALLLGSVPMVVGGAVAVGGALFAWWAGVNTIMRITDPHHYRLWKQGGGDPWFDTLPELFNPDPPEVRYRELFLEKLRQEEEEN